MNDNVVPFKPKSLKTEPDNSGYLSGRAYCFGCAHVWEAVAPVGTYLLECPNCHLEKGHFTFYVNPKIPVWQCNCGCELFFACRDGIFCPNCGIWQNFGKD
jgi:hypothetical protein